MKRVDTLILAVVVTISLHVTASSQTQSKSREQVLAEIAAKRKELTQLEEEFLAPAESDRAAFSQLLSQPNTGLIRLLPRDKFESEAYKKNQKTLTIRGGGAYYSFVRLTHEYGYGSDLELQMDYLSVGFAGADYGIMLKIGDVPLEDLSTEHAGIASLAAHRPPSALADARVEQRRFSAGTVIDGLTFINRLPVEVNTSYALRSINYDESDVLVVFRVARKDTDGSVIIAWKQLRKYDKPILTRISDVANAN